MCVQANLDRDVIVSPANEYEVLQLLLSDCRDRLTNFNSEPTFSRSPDLSSSMVPARKDSAGS